jgi:hypothetical protein
MPEPAVTTAEPGSEQPKRVVGLVRQNLVPSALVPRAPWHTVDDAVKTLHEAGIPQRHSTRTQDGISATLSLLHDATTVQLSPAGHFLLFQSRTHKNQPLRSYVVHVASGAHLIRLGDLWMHDYTSPGEAEMDLTPEAMVDYVDALERLPGSQGAPVSWGTATGLEAELGRWLDPQTAIVERDLNPGHGVDHARRAAARLLHRTAVLHAVAASPGKDLASETVQQVLLDLLGAEQPRANGRTMRDLAEYLSTLLTDLNGGRRYRRDDTRTAEVRQGDAQTSQVVSRAVLNMLANCPHEAIRALREHAVLLQEEKNWYVPTNRVNRLRRAALMIAELFSPVPTESERLRHITPGDVLVVLRYGFDRLPPSAPVELKAQVTGPVQYTHLGLSSGDEEFLIPVNTFSDDDVPRPGVLKVAGGESFRLFNFTTVLMRTVETVHISDSAVDRWAILPASTALLTPGELIDPTLAASRRAAEAFDQLPASP